MTDLHDILPGVTKPARYTGGEWNSVVKDWGSTDVKIALAYPDTYEIGMSNLGLSILYHLVNNEPYALAERVYAPWIDMRDAMKSAAIPLFSLESKRPLRDFDIVGFSLGYELTYTNVLGMLDLAGIPLLSSERRDGDPLIIAGGSCALNPEPMWEFIDLFVMGEGEEVVIEFLRSFRDFKMNGGSDRHALLRHLSRIPGVYVPAFYDVSYNSDNTVSEVARVSTDVPKSISRRIMNELLPAVTSPVIPYISTVHDRAMIEIQRGCTRGCRFCHAGVVYRPVRERPVNEILAAMDDLLKNTGYNELSLLSLSTSDYSNIEKLINNINLKFRDDSLKISLPSLRLDSFSVALMDAITAGKKTSLTFAPEAGSERLRRVINKSLTDDVIINTLAVACSHGWNNVKLYFMLGLPTETSEDIEAIAALARRAGTDIAKQCGRRLNIKLSASAFVPKPHTPFQWVGQVNRDEMNDRIDILRRGLKKSGTRLTWQDPRVSFLESVLSRGDRRLSRVIHTAWRLGAGFDAWSERFRYDLWLKAFEDCSIDPSFYANRTRPLDEVLPWNHIDTGVSIDYLKQEYINSTNETATDDCRVGRCNHCGLERVIPACGTLL
ncbi:MAG: TIGR03960 family B12-binding radical SAM protein [Dehalococcoidia bacterium]